MINGWIDVFISRQCVYKEYIFGVTELKNRILLDAVIKLLSISVFFCTNPNKSEIFFVATLSRYH